MSARVAVALISLLGTIAVALWTAYWTSLQSQENRKAQAGIAAFQAEAESRLALLQHDLAGKARRDERRENAEQQSRADVERHRIPLVDAANELGARIDNFRTNNFLAYLQRDHPRRQAAIMSTLYRLARYFGTLEALYGHISYLKLEGDEDTREVAALLADIGDTFATDSYDRGTC